MRRYSKKGLLTYYKTKRKQKKKTTVTCGKRNRITQRFLLDYSDRIWSTKPRKGEKGVVLFWGQRGNFIKQYCISIVLNTAKVDIIYPSTRENNLRNIICEKLFSREEYQKQTQNIRSDCRPSHPYGGDQLVRLDCPKRMALSWSTGDQGETRMDVHKMCSLPRKGSPTEIYWTNFGNICYWFWRRGATFLFTVLRFWVVLLSVYKTEEWSSQWIFQFKQLERRSLKKIRASLLTGRYELNKLTSLPMCGFIAQLVEHRTGIAGSNPVEALIFFQASSFQLLKLENSLRGSFFTFIYDRIQIYELFHIYLHHFTPHGKIWTQQTDLAPNVWLHSSVGRASHPYRGGHGFESRWSPAFFSGFFFPIA